MLCKATINIVKRSVRNNARVLYFAQSSSRTNLTKYHSDVKQWNVQTNYNLYTVRRCKSHRKRPADRDDSDEESDEDVPPGSKLVTVNCSSIRLDLISKVGFGLSRNSPAFSKVDEAFYGSNIRLNGKKVLKKSKEIKEGDEIDLILHRCANNSNFLNVNRIVILTVSPASDGVRIKLSKDKNLLIEDYADPWSA